MVDEVGTLQLFRKLCEHQLRDQPKVHLIQPRLDKQAKKKHLTKVLFNTLFQCLQGPHGRWRIVDSKVPREESLGTLDRLYAHMYGMRVEGRSAEAHSLNKLLEALTKDGLCESVKIVLDLLMALRDSVPPVQHEPFTFQPDTEIIINHRLFELEPGQGIKSHCLFKTKEIDSYEASLSSSLFNGLIQSKIRSLDTFLDIPDLPDNPALMSIKIPKLYQSSEDEGFAETLSSSSGSEPAGVATDAEDVWLKAVYAKSNQHFTWEDLGCKVLHRKERPYISEAGGEAAERLYELQQRQLTLLDASFIPVLPRRVNVSQFIKDAINLLLAVPSHTFHLLEELKEFKIASGVHLPGTTPEGLANACAGLIECGTFYYKLVEFSQPPVVNSFYRSGLIFQAFTGAVRRYLQHYRAFVLSISQDVTLMQLNMAIHPLTGHIRYLADLCHCGKPAKGSRKKNFPTGVALLSYLYEETQSACGSMLYPMLLALFHASSTPYLQFVRNWVFHGICDDIYGEFLIQTNDEYLRFRDRSYWRRGYQLLGEKAEDVSPVFLKEVASDVFLVGKAINLLMLINPQHFLFSVEHDLPSITVTFSEADLRSVEMRCQMYLSRMQEMARQHSLTRQRYIERQERAKQDLITRAQRMAAQEMAKIQARLLEIRKANDQKKRRLFQELKDQMEKDLERRSELVAAERQRDKEYAEKATQQELLEAKLSKDLVDTARAALLDYYEELSEEAAYREQRAMWHVRRRRLHLARQDFLSAEEDRLSHQLAILQEQGVEAAMAAGAEFTTPGGDVDEVDKPAAVLGTSDLPGWAKRGLRDPETAGYEVQEADMPGWARKHMQGATVGDISGDSEGQPEGENSEKQSHDGDENEVNISEPRSALIVDLKSENDSIAKGIAAKQEGRDMKGILRQEGHGDAAVNSEKCVRTVAWQHANQQSQEVQRKPHNKRTEGQSASRQTEEVQQKPHIKSTEGQSATRQTQDTFEERRHLKMVSGKHSSLQSEELSKRPHLKTLPNRHANTQSIPVTLKVKKPNFFGHVSQLSSFDYKFEAPRLKKSAFKTALMESDWSCYQVKAHKKTVVGKHVSHETEETDGAYRPHARPYVAGRHVSQQSKVDVDMESAYVQRFRDRNIHGRHASDSSVQKLLYRDQFGQPHMATIQQEEIEEDDAYELWTECELERYQDSYEMFNKEPEVDLLGRRAGEALSMTELSMHADTDVEAHRFLSLPAIMHRSLIAPIKAQVLLVNQCVLDYFLAELQIEKHFEALCNFYLMQDGEFALSLTNQLFDKLQQTCISHEILNPVYLGNVLTQARQDSIHRDSSYANNISFSLKDYPTMLARNKVDVFNCLTLVYKVDWPVNIIITETCLAKYNMVFSFMLQLKRAVWCLKDVSHRLKRHCLRHQVRETRQMHQLQLFRHEMQHFVYMMQGYITNQILHVTWHEFQQSLRNNVKTLDNLHDVHARYLCACLFRCLLNPKAAPVMKIIQDIFTLILKFHGQLSSQSWETLGEEITHPAFPNMAASYKSFQEYSRFLFKVVSKLAAKGYQPHLQELLLRLNFNHYYQDS